MTVSFGGRRMAVAILGAVTLVLAGCMLMPGKFTSALDIRKDGRFTYTYAGEIHLLALSKLAEMGNAAEANAPFKAEPCHDDNYNENGPAIGRPVSSVPGAIRTRGPRFRNSIRGFSAGGGPVAPRSVQLGAATFQTSLLCWRVWPCSALFGRVGTQAAHKLGTIRESEPAHRGRLRLE